MVSYISENTRCRSQKIFCEIVNNPSREKTSVAILADQNTRVIVQGITGREAVIFTKDMIDYGTKVVAGVTPGKQGRTVHGVEVYDTMRQALKDHPAEASVVSVPPALVKGAAL